ncbi:o-succinylbenzoate synthase [Candidatus Hydrogenisulfobacillus filiaventi]|uniref:o-succinylbenzoate synthase n=1 Tax=Candidatus Hydrogenisulfobacillus filiaventi TaxID=2707344 RepID=A0A6F8ZD85_9FIRM|nr:o-succinylbenzoate synthase [Candidatus Hydrogenisulfobacillus filiaventi]
METVVEAAVLHRLSMPLRLPFETSYGREERRELLLVEVRTPDGDMGWGECVAQARPLYSPETVDTAALMLVREILPRVLGRPWSHPAEVWEWLTPVRGHPMAKFALEGAVWDLYARRLGRPLAAVLGGTRQEVAAGVSLGMAPLSALLDQVRGWVERGYRRVKIKIAPGRDRETLAALRQAFPGLALMADANGAYRWPQDAARLEALDDLDLLMLEQPFPPEDWEAHAALQARLRTPLCLDESIGSLAEARRAVALGACRVINVKPGRLGGFTPALALEAWARQAGVPLWCGGMLETGVGRALNVALASLPGFTLPGDLSASERYWEEDIIDPPVTLTPDGTIRVPEAPGAGWTVDPRRLARYERWSRTLRV